MLFYKGTLISQNTLVHTGDSTTFYKAVNVDLEDELRPILDWKYSDDSIGTTYWTSKSFTDYSWPFFQTDTAMPSSITRYYRRLITITNVKLTAGFILTFKSFGGCRVYVNGKAIHSYNLQPYVLLIGR